MKISVRPLELWAAALFLVVLLAGCATTGPRTYWTKPGATQDLAYSDLQDCQTQSPHAQKWREAQKVGSSGWWREGLLYSASGASVDSQEIAAEVQSCMKGKGYTK